MAFRKTSPAIMAALRDFVFRHEIFVEAGEFDDGFPFTRRPRRRSKRIDSRRHTRCFCGGADVASSFHPDVRIRGSGGFKGSLDFPEKMLLVPVEAAIEYEDCGRDAKRYAAQFPNDPDAARALFGHVRSESRLLVRLLGDTRYKELLGLVRPRKQPAREPTAGRRSRRQRTRTS